MSEYNENKQRRKKNIYRIRLGIITLINKPILNIVWIPIFILITIFENIKNVYISSLNIPKEKRLCFDLSRLEKIDFLERILF